MKLWRVVICWWMTALLVGCTLLPDAALHRRIDACKQVCTQQYAHCDGLCRDNCRECDIKGHHVALQSYRHDVHERTVSGQIVGRELQSYRDPLQCRKITCSCIAENAVCVQNCTGEIQKKLQDAPVCC